MRNGSTTHLICDDSNLCSNICVFRNIPADRPGLHIIKAPDGSVSKVMVR